MRIVELNHNQKGHHNTKIVASWCSPCHLHRSLSLLPLLKTSRNTYLPSQRTPPFAQKTHLTITGQFVLDTPEKCTVELAILNETERASILHPTDTCELAGCEFATQVAA